MEIGATATIQIDPDINVTGKITAITDDGCTIQIGILEELNDMSLYFGTGTDGGSRTR